MCKCQMTVPPGWTKAQADFVSCLITGVVTAMPYFLDSFLQCLAGNGSSGGDDVYQPGDRTRCAP